MSVSFKLPPSGRDFEVYHTVIVGGKSTREAAEQFRLSQTRICQIVERMRAWQAEVLPAECPLPEEGCLRLAQNIAVERINHLYCEVMTAWRKSQGPLTQTRVSAYNEATTTKSSFGDPKYVLVAMRLSKAAAELGVTGGLAIPDEEDGGLAEGRVPVVGAVAHSRAAETASPAVVREANHSHPHPVEDCSPNGHSQPIPAAAPAEPPAATAVGESTSSQLSPRDLLARRELFAPVQHDLGAAIASAAGGTQLQLDPQGPGVKLSRQQRRKLQRALRAK